MVPVENVAFLKKMLPKALIVEVFLLDGEKIVLSNKKDILDLYRPHRILLRNFTFPAQDFEAGRHILTLKFEGANPQIEEPEIGIDFLWIQKQ